MKNRALKSLNIDGTLSLKEQASANTSDASYGQLWVKTATPNELWFTDDSGVDFQLSGNSLPVYYWNVAWELSIWKIFEIATPWAFTINEFRISTDSLPTVTSIVVSIYKNGVIEATATITTWHTLTNWLYQNADTTFTTWFFTSTDRVSVEVTSIGIVPGTNLSWSLS